MTPRSQPQPLPPNLEEIFAAQIQALRSPYRYYRVAADRFLAGCVANRQTETQTSHSV